MSFGMVSKDMATIYDEGTQESYPIVSGKRFAQVNCKAAYELHAGMAIVRSQ